MYKTSEKPKIRFVDKLVELCNDVNVGYVAWLEKFIVIAIERDDFEVCQFYTRDSYIQELKENFLNGLDKHAKRPITTCQWSSFVRTLNAYGFRFVDSPVT